MKNQVVEKIWVQFTIFSLGIAILLAIYNLHPLKLSPEMPVSESTDSTISLSNELEVRVSDISGRRATLSWQTSVPTTYAVRLGTAENELIEIERSSSGPTNTHLTKINNLKPKRTYYVQIVSFDQSGSEQTSIVYSFRTKAW